MDRIFSSIAGFIFKITWPKPIQVFLNRLFVRVFHIDLNGFDPVSAYDSIQALFTRRLRQSRTFDGAPQMWISPCDALIFQGGSFSEGKLLQVKSFLYSVEDFLCLDSALPRGVFVNFYLSPQDYHHFHAPMDMRIHRIVHVSGRLFPVKPTFLKKHADVYVRNERVILEGIFKGKRYFMVLIAAFNVGNIHLYKEPRLQTNRFGRKGIRIYEYSTPLSFSKGEDLGFFAFGSSVVFVGEQDFFKLDPALLGKKVRYGASLAKLSFV